MKGERTRQSILERAVDVASLEGLEGLTIGRLADELKMSKSGLFAHFGSKEELQIATLEEAAQRYIHEIFTPALKAPRGFPRLMAICRSWLSYIQRGVFPGGCFFAATMAELRLRPSPVTVRLAEFDWYWMGLLRSNLELAQTAGEIPAGEDIADLAFEIESHVVHAHLRYPMLHDSGVLARVRRAVRHRLGVPPGP